METMIANISQEISQTKFTLSQCLKIAQTNKEELKVVEYIITNPFIIVKLMKSELIRH